MSSDFLVFVAIGLSAQLVDGCLGMAYGLTATSILLSLNVAPATASASVHAAEVFTTAASGAAHWRFGNIDRTILWRLVPAGMAGGFVGANVLVSLPGDWVRSFVALYLLGAGSTVFWRGVRQSSGTSGRAIPGFGLVPIGFMGGFLDAIGGGGWGALVTTTLLFRGTSTRMAVGTVSLAEFFVTVAISGTLFSTIGFDQWPIIAGLIVGGVIAAPLAALAARHLPDRPLMTMVGLLIVLLALRQIVLVWG